MLRKIYTPLLLAFFLPLSHSPCSTIDEVEEMVTEDEQYIAYLFDPDTYQPPQALTDEDPYFQLSSEEQKEEKLLQWFEQTRSQLLKSIALRIFWQKLIVLLSFSALFVILLGAVYLEMITLLLKVLLAFNKKTKGRDDLLLFGQLKGLLDRVTPFLYTINPLLDAPDSTPLPTEDTAKNIVIMLSAYYVLTAFKYPFLKFWEHLKLIINLIQFIRHPIHHDPLEQAKRIYIKSLYLFDAQQQGFLVGRILQSQKKKNTPSRSLVHMMRLYRALPKGVKDIRYSEEAFQKDFAMYSQVQKEVAGLVISTIIAYTKAYRAGKAHLFDRTAIKPLLLLGSSGSGKTYFLKKICKHLGVNMIPIKLTGSFSAQLQGGSRLKHTTISPGLYAKALLQSADERGRNYENSVHILEDVNSLLTNKASIDYIKLFLDPDAATIPDDYTQLPIKKTIFTLATTNEPIQIATIRDRFIMHKMPKEPPKKQKNFIKNDITTVWLNLLREPNIMGKRYSTNQIMRYQSQLNQKFARLDKTEKNSSLRKYQAEAFKMTMSMASKDVERASEPTSKSQKNRSKND